MNVGKELSQLTQFLIKFIFKISREGIDVTFLEVVQTFIVIYIFRMVVAEAISRDCLRYIRRKLLLNFISKSYAKLISYHDRQSAICAV